MGFQYSYVNNVFTTLSGAISNSTTSLTVASSTGFPTSFPFMIAMDDSLELIKVTNVVGTTWTIARGQESSTATSHANGATIRSVITKAITDTFAQLQTGTTTAQSGAVNIDGALTTGGTVTAGSTSTAGSAGVFTNQDNTKASIRYQNTGTNDGVSGTSVGNGVVGDTTGITTFGVKGTNSATSDGAGAGGKFDGGTHTVGVIAVTNHATKTAVDASNVGGGPGIKVDRLQLGTSYWLDKGTSFPGSPTSGDQFYRTDRNIQYYYDGTRWLSTAFVEALLIPYNFNNSSSTGTSLVSRMAVMDDYDIWLEKLQIYYVPGTAQSGVNFYTITASAALTSLDTKTSTTANIEYRPSLTFTPATYAKTNNAYAVTFAPSGTPGAISIICKLRYRLVG